MYDSGVYRRFTLVHFAYALVLTTPAALMLVALDLEVAMVALVIAEIVAFLLLPHLGWVRSVVDARLSVKTRTDAAMARAVLLLRMSDAHRRELHVLERIAAALRERVDAAGAASGTEDCFGIERLIELYVRLAIAHRASVRSLEVVGSSRIEEELLVLEARLATAASPQRERIERRVAMLRMRRDARLAAIEEQSAIEHDLSMISETLRWMQEKCASGGTDGLRAELDFALASRERDVAAMSELATLRDTDFDGSVIRLGRDPVAPRPELPQLRIAVAPSRPNDALPKVVAEIEPLEAANEDAGSGRFWTGAAREAS
jgi:hypothetical protein